MLLFLTTSMAAVTSRANKQYHKLEIRFRKNLAKLTGSAVRINSKKPKGKKKMKEKKKLDVATPGFKPAPQLPPAKKGPFLTTGPCDQYAVS